MTNIKDTKKKLGEALAAAREISNTGTREQQQQATEKVTALQLAISDAITEGAVACPLCKTLPHGMEHPTGKGGATYEIGCIAGCKPITHDDGTTREPRVRGGMMPKHAVEAWNGGPDFWITVAKSEPA